VAASRYSEPARRGLRPIDAAAHSTQIPTEGTARAGSLAPLHVDLPTEVFEQVRHLLNLIQDHQLADLFIQIQIGLSQDLYLDEQVAL
jgi:hypothetical protein